MNKESECSLADLRNCLDVSFFDNKKKVFAKIKVNF